MKAYRKDPKSPPQSLPSPYCASSDPSVRLVNLLEISFDSVTSILCALLPS